MFFAAIYVPDFPVEAIVRLQPELREQAVAVVEGTPPLLRVIAVNSQAADADVEPGMTKLQAEERLAAARVARISDAGARGGDPRHTSVFMRSPGREAAAHAALLDCACGFSPRVEDIEADTVILDIAGLERIFGPPTKLAREIAARCSHIGLEANVAVAANPDAAMLAARGFGGVSIIPEGREAERLGSLPVEVLSMVDGRWSMAANGHQPSTIHQRPEEMLDTLERWGMRTLQALAALPEVAVTERLGQAGLHWQRLARGATARSLHIIEPPLIFEEAAELEYPIALLEPLSFVLNRLLEQLCARLATRALATNELRLKLELEVAAEERTQRRGDAEHRVIGSSGDRVIETAAEQITRSSDHQITRCLRLPVPILDAKVFLKLLQLDLKSHPPQAPVVKMWLAAESAEPRRAQNGLFLPSAPEPEKLEVTLARIARVVGSDAEEKNCRLPIADYRLSTDSGQNRQSTIDNRQWGSEPRVGSPELLDTHKPGAFRMRKFAPAQSSTVSRQPSTGEKAVTALRVFRPPLHAEVSVRDGRPGRLKCEQVRGDILWSAGPWRISGDWWTDQPWAREEWDVCVGDALYLIYRDASGWLVEGTYD